VAATTLAFAVIHALLWTRAPIPEFDRLVDVSGERFAGGRSRDRGPFSWPDFLDLRAQQTTFSYLAASTWHQVSFVGRQASAVVNAGAVNGEFFQTFGLRAAAGRLIEPADDRPDAAPVVVLSYNFWRLRFDGDPGAIGTEVRVNGDRYRIVGVAPRGFNGADLSNVGRAGAIWVPLQTASGEVPFFRNGQQQTVRQLLTTGGRDARWLAVRARLAVGSTIEQASQQVRAIGRNVEESSPTPREAESKVHASRFGRLWFATEMRDDRPLAFGRLFIALVGFVLLIGATNLANLALARGASREHEFAVRRALGASRPDLIREHLVESAFMGAAAAGVAWLLVTTLSKRLVMEIPGRADQFLLLDPHVSGPVLAFAMVAGLSALAVAGLWPALQLTGSRLRGGLTSAGGTTPLHWHFHRRVIRWQVAGSAALLFLAAASISAIVANVRHAAGIDVDRLALATFSFSTNRYDQVRGRTVIDAVLGEVSRQPGIAAAAASGGLPFDGTRVGSEWPVTRTDEPLAAHDDRSRSVHVVPATSQIFHTLGVDLLRGRNFGVADTAASAPVAVISDSFARRLWGTPDVVGRDLVLWTPVPRREAAAPTFRRVTVVGVASDTDAGSPGSREAGVMYLPIDQHPISRAVFTVRAAGDDPLLALGALRSAIVRSAPDLVLAETGTGPILLARAGLALSVVGTLVTSIGGAALLLAMTGLFGIVSELVSRRSREFGVRAALGASQRGIMQLVLVDGVRPVLGGIALGAFAGAIGRSIIASFLSAPIPAVDPVEFLAVAVLLVGAAAGACYWPARRAARVDPAVALRVT
jgi:predicted permease